MATLPIVNTGDKRIGIVSAITLMAITFIILLLMTYEIPNPLPEFHKMPAMAQVDQIVMKNLVVEAGGGGGTPTDAPKGPDVPQTDKVLTNTTKPSVTKVPTGQSNHTNANNNTNNASTNNPSNDPFGGGGSGGGPGSGNGPGFGNDSGSGSGPGTIGFGKGRSRLSNVNVDNISIETDAKIYYKLTVDAEGNVVDFSHYASKTTTTDQTLINKIGYEIKKQVKFSRSPGSPLVYQDYPITVKAQ